MYTRNGHGRVNDYDADKLKAPKFDIARRTIFVIHGWRGECLFVARAPRKGDHDRPTLFLKSFLSETGCFYGETKAYVQMRF